MVGERGGAGVESGACTRLDGAEGEDVDAEQRCVEDEEQEEAVVALRDGEGGGQAAAQRSCWTPAPRPRTCPMVLPTQGQWWSNFSTQSLLTEQWWARGGW